MISYKVVDIFCLFTNVESKDFVLGLDSWSLVSEQAQGAIWGQRFLQNTFESTVSKQLPFVPLSHPHSSLRELTLK